MIKKRDTCLYCGEKMESKSAKKLFCSDKCRIYYQREKARGTLGIDVAINDGKAIIVRSERDSVLPKKKELEKLIEDVAPTGLTEKNKPVESKELPDFYLNEKGWKITFKPDYSKMPKGLEFNDRQEWMKNASREQLEKFHKGNLNK